MDKQAAVVCTMAACIFVLYPKNRPVFLLWKPGRFVCVIGVGSGPYAIPCGGS